MANGDRGSALVLNLGELIERIRGPAEPPPTRTRKATVAPRTLEELRRFAERSMERARPSPEEEAMTDARRRARVEGADVLTPEQLIMVRRALQLDPGEPIDAVMAAAEDIPLLDEPTPEEQRRAQQAQQIQSMIADLNARLAALQRR